ncbi:MAG: hypothetical protein Q9168_008230, partial [Polycauliona sp. 1 TL-2023]
MADYATKIARQDSPYPRLGNILQDMLGAASENDASVLNTARQWFGAARDVASGNVVIHCSDTYLSTIDSNAGVYRDNTRQGTLGGPRVQIPKSSGATAGACGGRLRAFAYPFEGGNVIVLCSDSPIGALLASTSNSLDPYRRGGAFGQVDKDNGIGLNAGTVHNT